jgi:hypothetical protein
MDGLTATRLIRQLEQPILHHQSVATTVNKPMISTAMSASSSPSPSSNVGGDAASNISVSPTPTTMSTSRDSPLSPLARLRRLTGIGGGSAAGNVVVGSPTPPVARRLLSNQSATGMINNSEVSSLLSSTCSATLSLPSSTVPAMLSSSSPLWLPPHFPLPASSVINMTLPLTQMLPTATTTAMTAVAATVMVGGGEANTMMNRSDNTVTPIEGDNKRTKPYVRIPIVAATAAAFEEEKKECIQVRERFCSLPLPTSSSRG